MLLASPRAGDPVGREAFECRSWRSGSASLLFIAASPLQSYLELPSPEVVPRAVRAVTASVYA